MGCVDNVKNEPKASACPTSQATFPNTVSYTSMRDVAIDMHLL